MAKQLNAKMTLEQYRKAHPPKEHDEQSALVRWAEDQVDFIPALEMLFAIPNGAKLPFGKTRTGQRYSKEAIKLKREGLKQGIPDLMLAYPASGKAGLFLEMKRQAKSTVSAAQKEMIAKLQAAGYAVEICKGWEHARDVILKYLEAV